MRGCVVNNFIFRILAVVVGIALVNSASAEFNKFNPVAVNRVPRIQIDVAPGNWGRMDPRDVQRLLEAVARQELSDIPPLSRDPLLIYVIPRNDFPEVMLERNPDGAYVVRLTARDEHLYQYAYQFSHELCHILSNFDQKERRDGKLPIDNQWFEESLCEAVAIFTLQRLATTWDAHPPSRKWIGYGTKFSAYADQLRAQPHRQLPPDQTFDEWHKSNFTTLRNDPYIREKNELVAEQLLPIFGENTTNWQSITYLNPFRESAAQPFPKYLNDWYQACPGESRVAVKAVLKIFGRNPRLE
jgi:hypothetical protein